MLLIVAKTNEHEPCLQVGRGLRSQPLYGVDEEALRPGHPAAIDAGTRGWPLETVGDIPAGE